jgi:hypothetical protein
MVSVYFNETRFLTTDTAVAQKAAIDITVIPGTAPQQVPSPRGVAGKLKRFYGLVRKTWETFMSFRKRDPK